MRSSRVGRGYTEESSGSDWSDDSDTYYVPRTYISKPYRMLLQAEGRLGIGVFAGVDADQAGSWRQTTIDRAKLHSERESHNSRSCRTPDVGTPCRNDFLKFRSDQIDRLRLAEEKHAKRPAGASRAQHEDKVRTSMTSSSRPSDCFPNLQSGSSCSSKSVVRPHASSENVRRTESTGGKRNIRSTSNRPHQRRSELELGTSQEQAELKAAILSAKRDIDKLQKQAELEEGDKDDLEARQAVLEAEYDVTCSLLGELYKRRHDLLREIDRHIGLISDLEATFGFTTGEVEDDKLLQACSQVQRLSNENISAYFFETSADDVEGLQDAMEQIKKDIGKQRRRKKTLTEDLRTVEEHIDACGRETKTRLSEKLQEYSELQTKFRKTGTMSSLTCQKKKVVKPDVELLRQTLQFCWKLMPKEAEEVQETREVVYNNPEGSIVLLSKGQRQDEFTASQKRKIRLRAGKSSSSDKLVPLKHDATIFPLFEQLGMDPPMFNADLPGTIARLEKSLAELEPCETGIEEKAAPSSSQSKEAENRKGGQSAHSAVSARHSSSEEDAETCEAKDDEGTRSGCAPDADVSPQDDKPSVNGKEVEGDTSIGCIENDDIRSNADAEVAEDRDQDLKLRISAEDVQKAEESSKKTNVQKNEDSKAEPHGHSVDLQGGGSDDDEVF